MFSCVKLGFRYNQIYYHYRCLCFMADFYDFGYDDYQGDYGYDYGYDDYDYSGYGGGYGGRGGGRGRGGPPPPSVGELLFQIFCMCKTR